MDLTLTEEQEQIRDAARQFLKSECPPSLVRELASDPRGHDPRLWSAMAELGWMGLELPEEHDGFGATLLELALVLEEQGRRLLPSPFVPTVVLAAHAIARFGTDVQRAEHLPKIASGRRIFAVARTGPTGSWDPTDVGVVATPDGGTPGGGVALDGEATLVEHAAAADWLLVVARHGDSLAAYLVPADSDGVSTEPLETIGRDHRHRVSFRSVRLPGGAALAGDGVEVATSLAQRGAVARCAEMVGAGQQVLDETVAHASERIAFGKPIGSFQAVQHHCADMAVDVHTSRTITREAAWRLSQDGEEGGDAAEAVSLAKAWVSDAIARVAATGHQVHGAVGFTAEHDPHLYSRSVRAAELDFGDAAWHRGLLADALGI